MKKRVLAIAATAMATMMMASPVMAQDFKIGICNYVDDASLNQIVDNIQSRLEEIGKEKDVNFDVSYDNCNADANVMEQIISDFQADNVDLMVGIATPVAMRMQSATEGTDTPVVFIAVSAPVAAGVITDMDHPDKNATGTSNAIPVSDIFALSKQLTPDCKTFGFLYCTSEVNSVNTIEAAKEYCDANGLSYKEATVTNSSEVQQAAQSLVGSVDAIFVPNDSVIQASMTLVTEVARDAKIPVYGSSATMVDSGAFATVAISDKGIGAMSADMAVQILEGTAVADIPAVVVPASATVINNQTLEALGITLSEDVQSTATFVDDAK